MNTAPLVLAGFIALAAASPVTGQVPKEKARQPASQAMKVAAAAGVYIGIMERCQADTTAIRAHYRARVAETAGDDGRDQALALFEGTISRSAAEAARRDVPGACEKTRAAPWTEFRKVIDGLVDGKGRF